MYLRQVSCQSPISTVSLKGYAPYDTCSAINQAVHLSTDQSGSNQQDLTSSRAADFPSTWHPIQHHLRIQHFCSIHTILSKRRVLTDDRTLLGDDATSKALLCRVCFGGANSGNNVVSLYAAAGSLSFRSSNRVMRRDSRCFSCRYVRRSRDTSDLTYLRAGGLLREQHQFCKINSFETLWQSTRTHSSMIDNTVCGDRRMALTRNRRRPLPHGNTPVPRTLHPAKIVRH